MLEYEMLDLERLAVAVPDDWYGGDVSDYIERKEALYL